MKAIGLNFADIYRRKGNYHLAGNPPFVLGYEGAGIVEKVGSGVSGVQPGDRIGFADVPYANAELVAVPIEKMIPLPDDISFETAASVLLQGLTAHYLTRDSYVIKQGDVALVHAAAGGVGQLLVQIVKLLGGIVVALTSSESKAEVAKAAGADMVFLYHNDWKQQVLDATNGKGVDVVYESVGSTLMDSFAATRTGGTVVFYGMAGGDPAPVDRDAHGYLEDPDRRRSLERAHVTSRASGSLRRAVLMDFQWADSTSRIDHLRLTRWSRRASVLGEQTKHGENTADSLTKNREVLP